MISVPGLVYGALFGFTARRSLKCHPRISDITEDIERTALCLADGGRIARYRLLVVDKCKKGGAFKAKPGGISARFARNGHAKRTRLSHQAVANKFADLLRLAKAGKDSQVPDHGFIFKPRRSGGSPAQRLEDAIFDCHGALQEEAGPAHLGTSAKGRQESRKAASMGPPRNLAASQNVWLGLTGPPVPPRDKPSGTRPSCLSKHLVRLRCCCAHEREFEALDFSGPFRNRPATRRHNPATSSATAQQSSCPSHKQCSSKAIQACFGPRPLKLKPLEAYGHVNAKEVFRKRNQRNSRFALATRQPSRQHPNQARYSS